jgi:hypothetical protein
MTGLPRLVGHGQIDVVWIRHGVVGKVKGYDYKIEILAHFGKTATPATHFKRNGLRSMA